MPTRRNTSVALGLVIILLGGCAPAATSGSGTPTELSPLSPPFEATNHASSLIANNSGGLRGTVLGPSASLVSNNAASLIGNNAAGLIGNNAGGLIGNNAGGFAGLGGYGLLATATEPAGQAKVAVFDDRNEMVSDGWLDTDADGGYVIEHLKPSSSVLFVRATYTVAGTAVSLQAVAAAPREEGEGTVTVTPATTLVAKKVDHLLRAKAVQPGSLQPQKLQRFAEKVEGVISDKAAVAAAVLETDRVAGVFDAVVESSPELKQELATLGEGSAEAALLLGKAPAVPAPGPQAVSTLAGSSVPGFTDGVGPDARFNYPYGVAAGPTGRLFVSDFKNHAIRQVQPDGTVKTLAGAGEAGMVNGTGEAARFNGPRGLAVDVSGNVYVADGGNACIRKVAPDGAVTTFAGTGVPGFADGDAETAQFKDPRGVAIDGKGNVYVADTGNLRIRKITPSGAVSTVLELPQPSASAGHELRGPFGIALDGEDTLYIADTSANAILRVAADGTTSVVTKAGLAAPVAIAFTADGRMLVADFYNHSIRLVGEGGVVATLAGTGSSGLADGEAASARFYGPYGIAVSTDGHLYVADTSNHRLRKVQLPE